MRRARGGIPGMVGGLIGSGMVGGLIGVLLGIAGTALWRRWPRTRSGSGPLHMPNELLLTLHYTAGAAANPLTHEDERVRTLLRRAANLVGGHGLHVIEEAPPAGEAAARDVATPLTLRLHAPRPHSRIPRRHVNQAADRINGGLDGLRHHGIAVSSAMPNWLISCSGGGTPHYGPGAIPEPAPPGGWTFAVPEPGSWPQDMPDDFPDDSRVVVAVLDTSPGWQEVHRAAARPLYQPNALLRRLAAEGDERVMTYSEKFSPPDDVPQHHRANSTSDHGLFVSGIIHSIAPHAEIRLLHVLDDRGSGRTDLLLKALDDCLAMARSGRQMVVNLSLYLMIPPEDGLWRHWFGPLGPLPPLRIQARNAHQQAALLAPLHSSLEQRIDLLLDAGAVVVAAAGNDAFTFHRHPQPRLPADYDGVLCVVATDRDGKLAAYSNRADVPPTGNCVATYGGQGILKPAGVVVPPGPHPRDGVVGLYAHHDVPTDSGPQPNEAGWVYWSGTSFATPIVSAIAANVLARDELQRRAGGQPARGPAAPRLTPRAVMDRILAMAEPPQVTDPALGCPWVRVSQQQ